MIMLANIGNSLWDTGALIWLVSLVLFWFGRHPLSYPGMVAGSGLELAGALMVHAWILAGFAAPAFGLSLWEWWDHHDDDPRDKRPAEAADGDESRLLISRLLGNLRDRTIPQGA